MGTLRDSSAIMYTIPWAVALVNQVQKEKEGNNSKRWANVLGNFNPKKGKQIEGSGEHFLFEPSGTEGLERAEAETAAEAALGSETCEHAQVLVAMVPSCWPARFHQHSLSATVPVLWAAAAASKKEKIVCILMAAGSLNTMSGKNKEKMVRDRKQPRWGQIPLDYIQQNLDILWYKFPHEYTLLPKGFFWFWFWFLGFLFVYFLYLDKECQLFYQGYFPQWFLITGLWVHS